MAAWFSVLQAAMPFISNIVAAAIPAFTRGKDEGSSSELVEKQIVELQQAVTSNAESVKGLASQVAQTLTALDASEAEQAQRLASLQAQLVRDRDTSASEVTKLVAQIQAQDARLDGLVTELQALKTSQTRIVEFERQLAGLQRLGLVVLAVAVFTVIAFVVVVLKFVA
jgi:chromosome segregation ATPase